MQQLFHDLSDHLGTLLRGGEVYTAWFDGEDTDFVRFNHAKVRQATHVVQRDASVDLIDGRRHASGRTSLSGRPGEDRERLRRMVERLRAQLQELPEDPYLLYSTDVRSSERVLPSRLPDAKEAVADIQAAAGARDLVGIWASGSVHAGFANSLGQRNWSSAHPFNFDWSCYHAGDKATKSGYAGFEWDRGELARKVELQAEQLRVLAQPSRAIKPGRYRAYFTPAALRDVVDLVASEAFGLKARRTKQSPLQKLFDSGARLSPLVRMTEDTAAGVAPNFQEAGFLKPDRVPLLDGGAPAEALVSPRSAGEYGVAANGASEAEQPQSLQMSGGSLPEDRVLAELGTGVWMGNVWYLNYSDRSNCRTTGMTRFATFWVENGVIAAPLDVMRFDETLYRMLGDRLVGLTDRSEWILDADTYGGRSLRSARVPGALVDDFTFTL